MMAEYKPYSEAKDYTPIRFGDMLFAASGETIEPLSTVSRWPRPDEFAAVPGEEA